MKGIKKLIKVRDRLHKDMIRTKNIQLHQIKKKSFKKYRDRIVKTKEIPKLYDKGFIILHILKRAIELTLPVHCL